MSEQNVAADAVETKAPVEPTRLCKGTMPTPLVWFIKFHETAGRSDIAKKYFTTPGKIADIQTDANQKYVVKNMSFSPAELEAARENIRENFVRGQAAEAAVPGSVGKRGLASTKAGDEKASLEAIDKIAAMDVAADAITLSQARVNHNMANPRPTRVKKDGAEASAEPTEGSDDDLDDLLDE
jgi:hypothetical protein